jgi:hypothetical protein
MAAGGRCRDSARRSWVQGQDRDIWKITPSHAATILLCVTEDTLLPMQRNGGLFKISGFFGATLFLFAFAVLRGVVQIVFSPSTLHFH